MEMSSNCNDAKQLAGYHHVRIDNELIDMDWIEINCLNEYINIDDDWFFKSKEDAALAQLVWQP